MNRIWNKFIAILRGINRDEKGIAAMPTIVGAFSTLVVAGTLAGTVVDQGDDLSQEVQKVVQETIQNIEGTYQIKGCVIGRATATGSKGTIGQLTFTVSLASSGGCTDFTPPAASADNTGLSAPDSNNIIIISYTDEYQHVENLYWTLEKLGKNDGDNFLEGNELFQITIGGNTTPGKNGGNMVDALSQDLSTYTTFDIEIKTPQGVTLRMEQTTPSSIENIVNFG
jgi:archaellin